MLLWPIIGSAIIGNIEDIAAVQSLTSQSQRDCWRMSPQSLHL